MLSDLATIVNSLKVKILDKSLNKAILINGHLFIEDLNGWIYVGSIVHKGKSISAINLYNKFFEAKPIHLDIGTDEKNFYPHYALPTQVAQRLTEIYEFYKKNNHNKIKAA